MGKEQKILIAKQMREDLIRELRKKKRLEMLRAEMAWGIMAILVAIAFSLMLSVVVEDRIKKYPQLGTGWVPKTEVQRKKEAEPHKYVGR